MSLFVEALELDGDSNVILKTSQQWLARLNSLPEPVQPVSAATDI